MKPKYSQKSKLCYCVIVYIKRDEIKDVKTRFDTSNYELDRPLLKGKIKKVIRLMKYELGGKIMKKLLEQKQELIGT